MDHHIANDLYSILYEGKSNTIHGTPINNLKTIQSNSKVNTDKDVRDQQKHVCKTCVPSDAKNECTPQEKH